MRDEKKTFYLVAGDVLPEAILKTAEIKALTSLASQAQHIQDEQIASVSASVLAENNKSLSSERDKQ